MFISLLIKISILYIYGFLATFIREVFNNIYVTKEFLDLIPMTDTTTNSDLYNSIENVLIN